MCLAWKAGRWGCWPRAAPTAQCPLGSAWPRCGPTRTTAPEGSGRLGAAWARVGHLHVLSRVRHVIRAHRAAAAHPRPLPFAHNALQVVGVEGNCLILGGADIIDGSPILDIKPYVPFCDGVPGASAPSWVQVSRPLAHSLAGARLPPWRRRRAACRAGCCADPQWLCCDWWCRHWLL